MDRKVLRSGPGGRPQCVKFTLELISPPQELDEKVQISLRCEFVSPLTLIRETLLTGNGWIDARMNGCERDIYERQNQDLGNKQLILYWK